MICIARAGGKPSSVSMVIHLMSGIAAGLLRSLPVPPPGTPKRSGIEGALLKAEPI